jgi:hypothetical protein
MPFVSHAVAPHVPPVTHAWEQQKPTEQTSPGLHWSLVVHVAPRLDCGWQVPAPTPSHQ